MVEETMEQIWHDLHGLAELGNQEARTSAYLAAALETAGFSVETGVGGTTGVVGTLSGKSAGPVFALRADMDALPFEEKGRKFVFHGCGHDANMTAVLTAAQKIAAAGIEKGRLKIIFQPAEELSLGALAMAEAGAIDDVDYLAAGHLRPIQELPFGKLVPAILHGADYLLDADFTGATAHVARPQQGASALDAAVAAVNALHAIPIDPMAGSTVQVVRLESGIAENAIPGKAFLEVDLRARTNEDGRAVLAKMKQAIQGAAASFGVKVELKEKIGGLAPQYDEVFTKMAAEAICETAGEEALAQPIVTPGVEDFHFYVQKKPSLKTAYIGIGADLAPGLHQPDMHFNHAAMQKARDVFFALARRILVLKK